MSELLPADPAEVWHPAPVRGPAAALVVWATVWTVSLLVLTGRVLRRVIGGAR